MRTCSCVCLCHVYSYKEMMLPCWEQDPKSRPTITLIKNKLELLMSGGAGEGYYPESFVRGNGNLEIYDN